MGNLLKKKLISLQIIVVMTTVFALLVPVVGFAFSTATLFNGDQSILNGSVVRFSSTAEFIEVSDEAYDEDIVGIALDPAPVVYRDTRDQTGVAVVESGVVSVRVSDLGGTIKQGDYVTSSSLPGVAQRANDLNQTVLGIAVDAFEPDGTTVSHQGATVSVGLIRILVDVGPATVMSGAGVQEVSREFLDVISSLLRDLIEQPGGTALFFRYVVALLITLLAVFFSIQHFGRATLRGIEAIGRNPLAKKQIQFTVAMNVLLGVLVSAAAVILSFFLIV